MICRLVNADPANSVNELWTRRNIPSLANTKLETDNPTFAQCRTYCKGGQEQHVTIWEAQVSTWKKGAKIK